MLHIHHVTGMVPPIPKSGLILHLDALTPMSYAGGSEWRDLSGMGNHIDLFGNIVKESRFIHPVYQQNGYGRSRSMLDLRGIKTITVINVSWTPNRSTGELSGLLYEHTAEWNIVNDYSGNSYGGFGFLPNSNGSFYDEGIVHAQLRGNGAILRGGSPYSGWNYLAPGMPTGLVHAVVHDFNDQVSAHQTTAYVNGVVPEPSSSNGSTSLSNNFFDRDFFYLWCRGGISLFSDTRLGALLIYNRGLSVTEIQQITQMYRKRFGV